MDKDADRLKGFGSNCLRSSGRSTQASQASTTSSPLASTATWIELRPCGAGGLTTAPVLGSNSEP